MNFIMCNTWEKQLVMYNRSAIGRYQKTEKFDISTPLIVMWYILFKGATIKVA